jgi:hypothetical protein
VVGNLNVHGAAARSICGPVLRFRGRADPDESSLRRRFDDAGTAHRAPRELSDETAQDAATATLIMSLATGNSAAHQWSQSQRQEDASPDGDD